MTAQNRAAAQRNAPINNERTKRQRLLEYENWGIAAHGEELIIAKPARQVTADMMVSFKLPKNVNIITLAQPGDWTSSFDLSWFVKLVKDTSLEYLCNIFKVGNKGEDERRILEHVLNTSITSMTNHVYLNFYSGEQNDACPDIILHTTNANGYEFVNDRFAKNTPWLDVKPRYIMKDLKWPLSLFLRRDPAQVLRGTTVRTAPKSMVEHHPCTPIVCRGLLRDPPGFAPLSVEGACVRYEGCVHMMQHTFPEDLDSMKTFCQYAQNRMALNANAAVQQSLPRSSNLWPIYNIQRLYGAHHTSPAHSHAWNAAAESYIHWKLFFSRKFQKRYGDASMDESYSNARFLLSDFVQKECNKPHVTYNIFVLSCRSRTIGYERKPGTELPPNVVLTYRDPLHETAMIETHSKTRAERLEQQRHYHNELGKALIQAADKEHIKLIRQFLGLEEACTGKQKNFSSPVVRNGPRR